MTSRHIPLLKECELFIGAAAINMAPLGGVPLFFMDDRGFLWIERPKILATSRPQLMHIQIAATLIEIDHPNVGFGRRKSVIKRAVIVGQPILNDREW